MIKIVELFAGIGACSKALKNLNIEHEIVDAVEIDKYALKSFNAIHGTNFETNDIRNWNKQLKDIDLLMHGSPCQDFSLAGKQAGGDFNSGTRSSLLYESIRIIKQIKPKYVIWENVKNVLSKKHIHNFNNYIKAMENIGYKNYYKVLNSKDFEIPQNRERVFTISIRNDIRTDFVFPQPKPLRTKLKDVLETDVDEKYYLSEKQVDKIRNTKFLMEQRRIQSKEYSDTLCARDWKSPKCIRIGGIFDTEKQTHQAGSVYDSDGLAPVIDTMTGGYRQPCIEIKNNTKKGYLAATDGDGVYISNMTSKRGTVQKEMIPTLKTSLDIGVVEKNLKSKLCNELIAKNKVKEMDVIRHSYSSSRMNNWQTRNIEKNNEAPTLDTRCDCLGVTVNNSNCLRIRKLTPKECWRLMGFSDKDFENAAQTGMSNTQLYKQAGNSIVVNVLMEILKNLF